MTSVGRLTLGLAVVLSIAACGSDGGDRPSPTPTPPVVGEEDEPFDLDLATRLGALCLQSYQMLADFRSGTSFSLPAPYALQKQFLTSEPFPGDSAGSEVPIAFVATAGDAIYVVFRGTKTISEWISDAEFAQVPYAYASGGGMVEQGFSAVYATIRDGIVDEVNALAQSSASCEGYKALVCVFLFGGNDATNMVLPVEGAQAYADYSRIRGPLALPEAQVQRIQSKTGGAVYGLQSDITCTAAFRPSVRSRVLKGLYLTGASTHLGGGVAPTIGSGMVAGDFVLKDFG